jgi:hypothetical protein
VTTLRRVKNIIKKFEPDLLPDDPSYETYLILLSSVVVGPNIKKISKFARIPRSRVIDRARRLRSNGVWVGPKVHCEWMDEEAGGISFIADALVADGLVNRVTKEA